jgi:hypothetical protein
MSSIPSETNLLNMTVIAEISLTTGKFLREEPSAQLPLTLATIESIVERISFQDQRIWVGLLLFLEIEKTDFGQIVTWIVEEFDYFEHENWMINQKCFDTFSGYAIHENCEHNLWKFVEFFTLNREQIENETGCRSFYGFLVEMVCLIAKPGKIEHFLFFSNYLLSDSGIALIYLFNKDMIEVWKKVRLSIKSSPVFSPRVHLKLLISVSKVLNNEEGYDECFDEDMLEYFESYSCNNCDFKFLPRLSMLSASRCTKIAKAASSIAKGTVNSQKELMKLISYDFIGRVFRGNFEEAFEFFSDILNSLKLHEYEIRPLIPEFVKQLVADESGFPDSRFRDTREELGEYLWDLNKKWFLIFFDKLQDHFMLESRIYDIQVAKYLSQKHDLDYTDILIISKLSQNSLFPLNSSFFLDLKRTESQISEHHFILRAMRESGKTIHIRDLQDSNAVKEFLTRYLQRAKNVSTVDSCNPLFYELGRLWGNMFGNQSASLNLIGIDTLPEVSQILFYIVNEIPSNKTVEVALFQVINSAHEQGLFNTPTEYDCICEYFLNLIKLNLLDRSEELLSYIDSFCCFRYEEAILEQRVKACLKSLLKSSERFKAHLKNNVQDTVYFRYSSEKPYTANFYSLLADRWDQLTEEYKKLLVFKAQSGCYRGRLYIAELSSYDSDLLLKSVESIVFKVQAVPVFDMLKCARLAESVKLKIAAHWFFVDEFHEISSYWSFNEFVNLALA